jgi:hypothetical protein
MKYALLSSAILGLTTIAIPATAQFSSFPTSSDSCSSFCVRLDLGSPNNDNSFSSGFSSSSVAAPSNLRWQLGVTWRPNPPEVTQVEAERTKQRLEDNRSLIVTLADAIAQNKTELARGLAILLAPRLGYTNPVTLIAEMKQGSMNIGSVPSGISTGVTNAIPPTIQTQGSSTSLIPPTVQSQSETNNPIQPTIELR